MLTTRKVHEMLADILQQLREHNEFMTKYNYKSTDRYRNPRTGRYVPGTTEDYTFGNVLNLLIGQKIALKKVLGHA